MKKGKLNPDRDAMPGGARIVDGSKQRGSRTASTSPRKTATEGNSEKRRPRSSSGQQKNASGRSQSTGKGRSSAQKSRPTSVGPA